MAAAMSDSDQLAGWHSIVHRLEQILALLDQMDEGDGPCAADLQSGLHAAQKRIRIGANKHA
ncbi:hypothetical protein [Sphingobium chungbukense]|uniref:Uncharacterized protein n=1 Tax=Sphingobium chungbukense TaxID=56193 RepID=A0A0M3AJM6_9SPHN|nr:hypothetical protein [Sphingobium chungbukense]KKW90173.1 hypothetical protein YP76_22350 [Sphingobium chungbukense]